MLNERERKPFADFPWRGLEYRFWRLAIRVLSLGNALFRLSGRVCDGVARCVFYEPMCKAYLRLDDLRARYMYCNRAR